MLNNVKLGLSGLYGKTGEGFTPELIGDLTSALSTWAGYGSAFALATDAGKTAPVYKAACLASFMACGIETQDLGITTQGTLQNYIIKEKLKGGVMISSRHKSDEHSALLFFNERGMKMTPNEAEAVLDIYHYRSFAFVSWDKLGKIKEIKNQEELYARKMITALGDMKVFKNRKFKVGIACGKKPMAKFLNEVLTQLGCKIYSFQYKDFKTTQTFIRKNALDICFFIASDTAISGIYGKQVCLEAKDIMPLVISLLPKQEKNTIIKNYIDTKAVDDAAAKKNLQVVSVKTGQEFVADALINEDAVLGGEGGEIMFAAFFAGYDAAATVIYILNALAKAKVSIDTAVKPLTKYAVMTVDLGLPAEQVYTTMNSIRLALENKKEKFTEPDGILIQVKKDLLSIRTSNSENAVRITAVAKDKKTAAAMVKKALSYVDKKGGK
ncbi:MAG: hypothetical protein WCJ46_00075 [bacterium]